MYGIELQVKLFKYWTICTLFDFIYFSVEVVATNFIFIKILWVIFFLFFWLRPVKSNITKHKQFFLLFKLPTPQTATRKIQIR